jgi:hypothetical protein
MRVLVRWVVRWEKKRPKIAKLVMFPAFLWICISGLLVGCATKYIIHYVAA